MASIFLLAILASSQFSISDDLRNEIYRYVFSAEVTLNDDDVDNTIDLGFVPKKGVIGDFVWNDSNENGIQDKGEDGLPGINVSLYILPNDETELFFNSDFTDMNGNYSFEVPFGMYKVKAGEGQEYCDSYIKIDNQTIPNHIRNFPWRETGLYAGDPKNDSNDHNGAIVVLDRYNQVNMTIDFGYSKYF
ncbi:MAG: SdrD B-like domain-containing protein [Methanocrinis sp.]